MQSHRFNDRILRDLLMRPVTNEANLEASRHHPYNDLL